MKRLVKAALVHLALATISAGAQSPTGSSTPTTPPQVRPALSQEQQLPAPQQQDAASREKAEAEKARREAQAQVAKKLDQETRARGYWIDPSTGLMWPANDNGKDLAWHAAANYCRSLRFAGFSDWRLATIDELASLVDKSAPAPERVGNTQVIQINVAGIGRHVRGGLSLTGDPWSSTRELDRFGHPYGDGWFFDFVQSKPSGDLPYLRNTKYALCVRRSGK
jgi:murein L,D-transpeptidase YcbB/YkuD